MKTRNHRDVRKTRRHLKRRTRRKYLNADLKPCQPYLSRAEPTECEMTALKYMKVKLSVTFRDYMRIPSVQTWTGDESIYKSSVKQKAQNHSYLTDEKLRPLSFLPLFGLGFTVSLMFPHQKQPPASKDAEPRPAKYQTTKNHGSLPLNSPSLAAGLRLRILTVKTEFSFKLRDNEVQTGYEEEKPLKRNVV